MQLDINDLVDKPLEETQVATSSSSSGTVVAVQGASSLNMLCDEQIFEEVFDSVAGFARDALAARGTEMSTEELQNIVVPGLEM